MLLARVIPVLLLKGSGLVKTVRFADPKYVGDPRNAVKIFNDKMADEVALLDIDATPEGRPPNLTLIEEIVSEAFMPIAYGGGIRTVDDARRIISLGVEKIIVASKAWESPDFIGELSAELGSQSVMACLDVKRDKKGQYGVYSHSGKKSVGRDPISLAREAQERGAGEILLNSVDQDGTMTGYDLGLTKSVADVIDVPLIACGGAGKLEDITSVIRAGASAAAAGSLFVFHGRLRSVLINYPEPSQLATIVSP